MVWLIAALVTLSIILGAHAYARGSNRPTGEDRPSPHPIIFLESTPSAPPADSSHSTVKTLLLLSAEDPQLERLAADSTIKLTTRSLLDNRALEPKGYGLYSYLLFGSSSEAGRQRRYAAARAYCENIPPISEALTLGIRPPNLNVFLAPTKSTAPKDTYCQNAKTLVDDYYDYVRAKILLQKMGLDEDGIYLVACNRPALAAACDPKRMFVVKLTTVKERLAELCVLEFRRQTRKKEYWDDRTLRSVVLALRLKFPEIAEFISFAEAAAAER